MSIKKRSVFFLIILLVPFAFSQNESLFYSDSLVLSVKLNSGFKLSPPGGKVDFVKANLNFYPLESATQEVNSILTFPEAKKEKNSYVYYWENPNLQEYKYSLKADIETHNSFVPVKDKIHFPIREFDQDVSAYVSPSEKIDVNDAIIAQASEIAYGEDDLFKVVFKLASWTKQNINYSITTATAEASQKASWVLRNRYGVCDELTNLFIAMSRSLGIPARFVSGVAYSNSEIFAQGWGLHGWAEVYFPGYGWVPFDPTYGQYGYVDATHIKLKDSVDSDKSSTKFEWQAIGVDLHPEKLETDVSILRQGDKLPVIVETEVKPFSNEVTFGSYNLIKAEFRNTEDYYVGFEAVFVKPKEVSITGSASKFIVLKPNEARTYYWVVKTDEKMDKHYIYSFPIEVVTTLGSSGLSEFKSLERSASYSYNQIFGLLVQLEEQEEKVYSKNVDILCEPSEAVYVGEKFSLNCDIRNEGNIFLKKLDVCMGISCEQIDLGISQTKRVEFELAPDEKGINTISVSSKNSQVSLLKIFSIYVDDKPKITLEKVITPDELVYGPDFKVSFDLWKHSESSPRNVTIEFRFNEREARWDIPELESNQGFDVTLDKHVLNLDSNTLQINVTYYDKNGDAMRETYEKTLPLKDPGILGKFFLWLNSIAKKIEPILQIYKN
jgi:hypothetical protein